MSGPKRKWAWFSILAALINFYAATLGVFGWLSAISLALAIGCSVLAYLDWTRP